MGERDALATKDTPQAALEDAYAKFLDCAGLIFSRGKSDEARVALKRYVCVALRLSAMPLCGECAGAKVLHSDEISVRSNRSSI